MTPGRIVVVGASRAGLAAVETLLEAGRDGEIVLIGAEKRLPYDRTTVSKQLLLGEGSVEDYGLCAPEALEGVRLMLGTRAVGLDVQAQVVSLDDGSEVAYDGLIIATGATPRRLPDVPQLAGVHELRDADDSLRLAPELADAADVVVVGGGFIGAEVASAARSLGREVTIVEAEAVPLGHALGTEIGESFATLHRSRGVRVLCGTGVAGLDGAGGRVERVLLADGRELDADVVVVGIGVVPEVGWLCDSGLSIEDGVVCDSFLAAAPNVFAAGDVAHWHHPMFERAMRVEHWTNAKEQGAAAARNLLAAEGERTAFEPVPYVWSDQHGIRMQLYGDAKGADVVETVFGSIEEGRHVTMFGRDGRLVAVFGAKAARELLGYRKLIADRVGWDEALELTKVA